MTFMTLYKTYLSLPYIRIIYFYKFMYKLHDIIRALKQ